LTELGRSDSVFDLRSRVTIRRRQGTVSRRSRRLLANAVSLFRTVADNVRLHFAFTYASVERSNSIN